MAGTFFSGLDLGQARDFSAFAAVETTAVPDPAQPGRLLNRFDVRHLHRWPLGTGYPAVVADIRRWYDHVPLNGSALVIDATGVGRPVVDMVRESGLPARVEAYTITGGQAEGDGTVPKKDLVGAVLAALQTWRLRFAAALPLRPVLERELETFRVRVTAGRGESFGSRTEADHDDLLIALALAVWFGEKYAGPGGPVFAVGSPQPAWWGGTKPGSATGW